MWIQSSSDWGMLFLSAILIGMSKTGIQGISLLAVPLMAMTFGAKPSTGLILPILCVADLIAVLYYRRIAEWKYVLKLLPAALAGFAVALLVDKHVPPTEFKHLMGGCLGVVLLVMLWSEWKGKGNRLSTRWWYGPLFGLLGGFTTMIGNAAGPVMAIYLLSVKMPKYSFVGTNAWFFLVINYLKSPFRYWRGTISRSHRSRWMPVPYLSSCWVACSASFWSSDCQKRDSAISRPPSPACRYLCCLYEIIGL